MSRWPQAWKEQASCKGLVDLFFPKQNQHKSSNPHAIAICNTCPVKTDCGQFALYSGERFGVWGGMTVGQLRDERNRLGIELPPLPNPTD
jgi:WhiB family redox-sensing transcriptional regulator